MYSDLEILFKVKVRPELELYGARITEVDIECLIANLPNTILIAQHNYYLTNEFKLALSEFSKKQFGFTGGSHVYIRGNGIYNDSDEIELDKENWHFYQRHRQFICDYIFKNKFDIVESLDYETDQIIKKFPKPDDHEFYSKKGLVVGYVQSGKTANFTHLISKAASIGYRFVIVLAGMTDTLRMQTQFRLDKELVGRNSAAIPGLETIKWLPGEDKFVPLTQLPDRRVRNDNGDFSPPVSNFTDHFVNTTDVTIAVIKKLARSGSTSTHFKSIIGSLINWIERAYDKTTVGSVPVLIIDDEADQASIDSTDPDTDPTVINHAIRKLLSLFQKSVYVGYTATPFANVFINPANDFMGLEDLYPKDFIYSLPEPDGYFGSNRFFGIRNRDNKIALVEYLEDLEKEMINDECQDITINLQNAIQTFIYSIIVRRFRHNDTYCGMMIHTDHRNIYHNTVYAKTIKFIFAIKCSPIFFQNFQKFIIKSKNIGILQGIVNEYPDYSYYEFNKEFDLIVKYLAKSDEGKTKNIRIINSREDKLDYFNEEHKYLICIGGNIMSRGVTIEGLTVTYYLRDTMKYDTLLQMGRWFGYRQGYEDLLRIYTTNKIADHLEFVMAVEDDFRNELNRYIEEGLTPIDFAPKVRAHIRMQPTAKMGNSSLTKSYSQQTVQTIYFNRDINVLENNYKIGQRLIEKYVDNFYPTEIFNYKFIARNVKTEDLLDFINSYNYSKYNSFDSEDVVKYIVQRISVGEINSFDFILSGIKTPKENSTVTRISTISINPVKRNLRKSKGKEYLTENIVNIGVISDTSDIRIAELSQNLTLIFYFIDKENSDAFNISDPQFSSDELIINPLGFTIVFPKTTISNGEHNYYQQIFE